MQILMMMTVWSFLKDLVADYLVIIRTTFEILVIIALINRPMESAAKMSWILLITLIPLAGTLFYVWTSIEMGYGTIRNKLTWINKDSSKYVMKTDSAYKKLDSIDKDSAALSRYLTKYDSTAVFENSKTEYFPLGQDKFLCMLEELEKAEELLNSYPPDDFDPIMVANMFMEAHFSEKAIDWLKKHGQGFEGEEDYMSILMNAYFYSGRYQEAIEMCEKLIDKDPFSAHYWLSLARCQLALGEYDKALDACDFSITNDEDMGEAYLTRCNLFALLSNDRKAKENLKHAIELHAVVPGDMNEMDLALLLDQDRVEDAIKLMNFYLKYLDLTEEQIVNTYFRLGVCYAHMRWDKQAFEYFDKVLEHRPNDAEVLTQKSMLYVNQENFDAALNQLKAAIENEPERKYLYRTII